MTVIRDLEWLAGQDGKTHHDAGYTLGPKDARQILERIAELEQLNENQAFMIAEHQKEIPELERELAEARDFLGQILDNTEAGKPWVQAVHDEEARKLIREINFMARSALGSQRD